MENKHIAAFVFLFAFSFISGSAEASAKKLGCPKGKEEKLFVQKKKEGAFPIDQKNLFKLAFEDRGKKAEAKPWNETQPQTASAWSESAGGPSLLWVMDLFYC